MLTVEQQNCYIEFKVPSENYFVDLKRVFELIKKAQNDGRPQTDEFWLSQFPKYSLKHFYFLDSDAKPQFATAEQDDLIWHFYSLTSLLQTDYEILYGDCVILSDNTGRIDYMPFGYPYGGVTGLMTFIASFQCTPTKIDDGTGVYRVAYNGNGDFDLTELDSI